MRPRGSSRPVSATQLHLHRGFSGKRGCTTSCSTHQTTGTNHTNTNTNTNVTNTTRVTGRDKTPQDDKLSIVPSYPTTNKAKKAILTQVPRPPAATTCAAVTAAAAAEHEKTKDDRRPDDHKPGFPFPNGELIHNIGIVGYKNGVLHIRRTAEMKSHNPDHFNLDRRQLMTCPVLEGEDRLKLLNFQSNFITQISNLRLPSLVFLDLYNNNIKKITGLDSVPSLRVLMLGKNAIKKLEGLFSLPQLDVLDLHNNQISCIENLSHLTELRVLNLAGNKLSHVKSLFGLRSLTEINLRRNQIETVSDLDLLPNLQRIFLSNNEIKTVSALTCLHNSKSLSELTLDGNSYRQLVIEKIKSLRHLDLKRVTEEEKRLANLHAKKEEERLAERAKRQAAVSERIEALQQIKLTWADDEAVEKRRGIMEYHPARRMIAVQGSGAEWSSNCYSIPDTATAAAAAAGSSQPPSSPLILDGSQSLAGSVVVSTSASSPGNPSTPLGADNSSGSSAAVPPATGVSSTGSPITTTTKQSTHPSTSSPVSASSTGAANNNDPNSAWGKQPGNPTSGGNPSPSASCDSPLGGVEMAHTACFQYIVMDRVVEKFVPYLTSLPYLRKIVFSHNNLSLLSQLSSLSRIKLLEEIDITDNKVVKAPVLLRQFISILCPNVKLVNGVSLTSTGADVGAATQDSNDQNAASVSEPAGVVGVSIAQQAAANFVGYNQLLGCTPGELARSRHTGCRAFGSVFGNSGTQAPKPHPLAFMPTTRKVSGRGQQLEPGSSGSAHSDSDGAASYATNSVPPSRKIASHYVKMVLSHACTIDSKIQLLNQQWDNMLSALVLTSISGQGTSTPGHGNGNRGSISSNGSVVSCLDPLCRVNT